MRAVIIGGSIAGLTGAMALARAGVNVELIEADDSSPSIGIDVDWPRRGVPQHRQAHAFLSLFLKTFNELAPDVVTDLVNRGGIWRSPEDLMPPAVRHRSGELDQDFSDLAVLNGRRPFVEAVLRQHVLDQTNIRLRSGQVVKGLTSRRMNGHPHVTGVVTESGETISSDIVLDASGRRSAINDWLREIGGRAATFLSEPANEMYFTRYYRLLRTDDLPRLNNGHATVDPFPWFVAIMFPGDNDTLQVAMGCLPEDVEMKRLRFNDGFHRVAMLAPLVGEWVNPERAEPISDVSAMGNFNNHLRRIVVDGHPVATGIHLIGDSAMISNPQYGRGVSHAAGHAAFVAGVVTQYPDDPITQALIVDKEVERMLLPSFESSIRMDRTRTAAWRASVGLTNSAPSSGVVIPETDVDSRKAAVMAATDPTVWLAVNRGALLLDPPGSWTSDPQMRERIATGHLAEDVQVTPQKPDRQRILAALT